MTEAPLEPADACAERDRDVLESGAIELVGQLAASSNETFLVEVTLGDDEMFAIYKPELGERPLHDFEPGLYRRERAAYLLSEHLGWGMVPRTIIRDDGPFGVGSLQLFVEHDPEDHYFSLYHDDAGTHDDLRRMALFDFVANNTDRKAGHVLRDPDGRIWGIDHGLCFSAPYKLRTVIWDFEGETISPEWLEQVGDLIDGVPDEIAALLADDEVRAVRGRPRRLRDGESAH